MHRHKGKCRVRLAVYYPLWSHAVVEFADVGYEAAAGVDDVRWPEGGVDDTDVGRMGFGLGARRGRGFGVEVWCAAVVKGDVLLGYQAGADAGTQVFVEEAGDFLRGDVLAAFDEALGQDGDGVGVRLDELGEDLGEFDFVFEGADGFSLPGE